MYWQERLFLVIVILDVGIYTRTGDPIWIAWTVIAGLFFFFCKPDEED